MMRSPWRCLFFLAVVGLGNAQAEQWPQFRGPSADGVSRAAAHPLKWSEQQNVQWKVKLEGIAWSQPIIWADKVFVTTALAEGQAAPKTGESGPGFNFFSGQGFSRALLGGVAPDINCTWKLICLDLETGQLLWTKAVHTGQPAIPIHRSNSYASDTPVTDGQHVFLQVPMRGVYCFDFAGKQLWQQALPARRMQYGWGTGSSLALWEDTLFLQCDNEQQSYLVALHKESGDEAWRVNRDETSNWSTPYLWQNRERGELITCGGSKTESFDPTTGEPFWQLPAAGRCATTAVGNQDLLFVGSVTKTQGSSSALVAIRAGAHGELSAGSDHIAWSLPKTAPQLASPLLSGDYLYALRQHGGIITCLDAASGQQHFRQRLPRAHGFTSSPWSAGNRVFCLDEQGQTFVIEPGAELKLLATNKLDGMFWSSAAVVDRRLLLRSVDHLYCISSSNR